MRKKSANAGDGTDGDDDKVCTENFSIHNNIADQV